MQIKNKASRLLKDNVRFQALKLLVEIDYHGAYSNVILDRFLSTSHLTPADQGLLVHLVYGTTQRRMTLDYYLEPFIQGKKVEDWVKTLLRLSLYQQLYMDRVPQHAILNEAVNIAKTNGHQGLGGFVNGVLRNIQRKGLRSLPDKDQDLLTYLSIAYSTPKWLVQELLTWYGPSPDLVQEILSSFLEKPKLTVRITKSADKRAEIADHLLAEGVKTEPSAISPFGLIVKSGPVFASQAFKDGLLTVQDESSMLVAPLGIRSGYEQVLDACAAPGGKATHIRQLLETGHLLAMDLSATKLRKVQDHLDRMGLSLRVETKAGDAGKFIPPQGTLYDTIYLDAPCSGLGLLRRKPEIKYQKQALTVQALADIQRQLIDHLSQFVKPGGLLIYSTCTLAKPENQELVQAFLADHPEFILLPIEKGETGLDQAITPEGYLQILPHYQGTDGFFIARLQKDEGIQ